MRGELLHNFREVCRRHKLAFTHQRWVTYEALHEMGGHPTPEELYAYVREQLPSISLATVYKTINTFLAAGIVREANLHHGPLRVDANLAPHHHLLCTRCKSLVDIDEVSLGPLLIKGVLPAGFRVERFAVEVQGLCVDCAAVPQRDHEHALPAGTGEDTSASATQLKRLAS